MDSQNQTRLIVLLVTPAHLTQVIIILLMYRMRQTLQFLEFSEISETDLSSCQNHTSSNAKLESTVSDDLVLTGIHAAASLVSPDGDEHKIFQAVMNKAVTLPVYSITHVPRSVRLLIAQVLAIKLEHGYSDGLWGFVRLFIFAKCIL